MAHVPLGENEGRLSKTGDVLSRSIADEEFTEQKSDY